MKHYDSFFVLNLIKYKIKFGVFIIIKNTFKNQTHKWKTKETVINPITKQKPILKLHQNNNMKNSLQQKKE